MRRSAFLKRMAFAALATWFLDIELPAEPEAVDVVVEVMGERFGRGAEFIVEVRR